MSASLTLTMDTKHKEAENLVNDRGALTEKLKSLSNARINIEDARKVVKKKASKVENLEKVKVELKGKK